MKKYNKINRKKEKEKGITLVALVITVVVMLILAGVAIAAVVDGDGLFSKTRQAAETYENAVQDEGDKIQGMINQIDGYIDEINNPNNPVVKDVATIGIIVTENQTYDGRLKGTYSNPIIPKGFAPINENGATWGSEDGYQKGLVIQDESENQFVWVPVDGTTVKFERHDFGFYETGDYSDYSDPGNEELENITESVIINGGFYIARYEAGIAKNMPQEELSSDSSAIYGNGTYKPVSKQGAIVWNHIIWGDANDDTNLEKGAVTVARSMYPESDTNYGVVSTLIYGIQWDTALKFIGAYDVGEAGYNTYATDSTGMGNYSGADSNGDTFSGIAICGAASEFRQKNIYDMAGNVWEWTMEKYSTYRVSRGGCYSGIGPASYRYYNFVDYDYSYKRFSCSTLYKVELGLKGYRID